MTYGAKALNSFQLPEVLIEPALGGPDTTERLNTAFAFRLYRLADGESCETLIGHLDDHLDARGKLTATLNPTTVVADSCTVTVTYAAEVIPDLVGGFTLGNTLSGTIPDGESVFVRVWDGCLPLSAFASGPKPLQDGIVLAFDADADGRYTPGDYWTFDVRAGEIANPSPLIDNQPPEGIRHHRVPLGVLNWNSASGVVTADIEDCRVVFDPLTRLKDCCAYRVGDGIESHGDFTRIQDAIDALSAKGGEVCVMPGVYEENVLIDRRERIIISGCSQRSLVKAPDRRPAPIFHIRDSRGISISGFEIRAHNVGAGDRSARGARLDHCRLSRRDA